MIIKKYFPQISMKFLGTIFLTYTEKETFSFPYKIKKKKCRATDLHRVQSKYDGFIYYIV